MEFHQYFLKLLREKDMSKAEVARRLKKTQPYIYHLCRGTKPIPRPDIMSAICRAVNANKEETQKLMDFSYQRLLGKYARYLEQSSFGKNIDPKHD